MMLHLQSELSRVQFMHRVMRWSRHDRVVFASFLRGGPAAVTLDWIDDLLNGWANDPNNDPGVCEQRGCREWAQTWCPLCEKYLCTYHDELRLERRHDCLGGRAEV